MAGGAAPACPQPGHEGSHVVRGGTYGVSDNRRQLWLCRRPDAGRPGRWLEHRFAEPLPRPAVRTGPEPDPPDSAQAYPRQYEFPVGLIAEALVAVGRGASYFSAAQQTRRRAPHVKRRRRGADRGANGTLVGDWVDQFTPILGEHLLPARWPRRLALAVLPFYRRSPDPGRRRHRTSWAILAAYDLTAAADHPARGLVLLRAVPAPRSPAFVEFLTALPGRPDVVV